MFMIFNCAMCYAKYLFYISTNPFKKNVISLYSYIWDDCYLDLRKSPTHIIVVI